MLKAYLKIKFAKDIGVKTGVEYIKKILSSGSSKEILIPTKKDSRLCEYHKDVECKIIQEFPNNVSDILICFPYCLSGATSGVAELINSLLYCSVFSFIENYIVEDFFLENKIDVFQGPRFGVTGIRKLVDVYQSPLLGIVLKPRTRIDLDWQKKTIEELCESGLINYIIDDELVIAPYCCNYEEKIDSYSEMIQQIEKGYGKKIIYWVNATADIELSKKIINYSINKGINTFCLNPVTMGFSAVKYLVDTYEEKAVILANNIGRGVLSRPPQYYITEKVLAKLSRLIGADAVYTGPISSAFPYDEKILKQEKESLQAGFCGFKPAFGVTSGDIGNGKNVGENVIAIGNDVMIQMGGGMLEQDASKRLKMYSFAVNYALNEDVLKEIQEVYITLEKKLAEEGKNLMCDKTILKKRNRQLTEFIENQLLLRNEYKQALTTTRDPQESYKYKNELDKCENTIIEFVYELNDLASEHPEIIDLDSGSYKTILQISNKRIAELDDDKLSSLIRNLDNLFEDINSMGKLDENIKEKLEEYNLETGIHNKIELSLPIIPLLLNYKVEFSVDFTKKMRKLLLKILQFARRETV